MATSVPKCPSCNMPLPNTAGFCPECGTPTPTRLADDFGADFEGNLRSALEHRYDIRKELGRGGMAVVYLAQDVKHDRDVALKVLRPDLAASLGAERFLREIRIAAKLSHPHILPLYDSGEAESFLYYVMPFVEGESLRDRLEREQQLPVGDAVQIAREVADGLGHAHSYGVIHRDIKPENILLSGGHAVIADFGIARAVSTAGVTKLTTAGASIGTPLYMSPEQGAGESRLDARTDLYSLGCVLYEMLTGSPPYSGPTLQSVLARHALDPIPRVRTVRETVPPGVEEALIRALAKVPADRFPSCSAFVEALNAAMTPQVSSAGAQPRRAARAGVDETEHRERLREALGKDYELGELIGRGGFAAVYVARDLGLDRRVAVKVLRPDLFPTPGLLSRFQREARAVAKLRHPHIVPIYSVGEGEGLAYFVMPLIEGVSLRAVLGREERIPVAEARRILVEAAQALHAAHREGIVHRDIKPDNIMLEGEERRVLLMDFGIAKALGEGEAGSTGAGVVVGTPQYLSPEQASAASTVDHRADIYSLGVIGYQLLAGRLPFEGASTQELIVQHIASPAPSLAVLRPDVPAALVAAVMRCLDKDPARRWESAAALAEALQATTPTEAAPADAAPGAANQAVAAVADAVGQGDCVLFFGLRLPTDPADDPASTSEHQLSELLSRWLKWEGDGDSLARVAQQLEMERGREEMLERLREAVDNPRIWPRDLVRRIAKLPFQVIVTTSYDSLLEEELGRTGRVVRSVSDCRRLGDDLLVGDLVVRIFGSLDDASSVVVTEDDLWEFFERFDSIADSLKSLFATRALLFVGYDPSDETFRHLFTRVKQYRTARTGDCYLVSRLVPEGAVRWAQRKGLQLIDLDPGEFLARLAGAIEERTTRAAEAPQARDIALPSRPYKFLNYYEESDARIFFGRAAEIRRFVSKIHAYPLNLLYAPSGSGKTSLIHAGLIPQLRNDGYLPTYARVYDDPAGEIRAAVMDATESAARGVAQDAPLDQVLPQVAGRSGKPLVVFLDQFEELFIRYDEGFRAHFAKELQKCIDGSAGRVRFVLALREDFLARLSEFREAIPSIFHNEYRLDALTEEAARAAIKEPAKLFGLEVEEKLADRLIADLATEGIEPPQLQIVCDALYDALDEGEKAITLKSYEKLGETRKILGQYLERVLVELPPDERRLAREILKTLVTSEETKTVSPADDIARLCGGSQEAVNGILTQLSDQRLVRRVPREEGFWYELMHEYLVEEIRGWLTEQERELKRVRELLEQAVRNYNHLGILIPPTQARLIRSHEADLRMSKEELELLKASELAQQTRRKRITIAAVAAVLLIALGLTTWRYAYLGSHWFVQAEDWELVGQEGGEEQTARYEGLRMYRGSADGWWLDRVLGFPRDLAQTDVDVEDLAVEYRDRVKEGMTFSSAINLVDAIQPMLRPVERAKVLALAGDSTFRTVALDLYRGGQQVVAPTLDSLSAFLAHGGLMDAELLEAALSHTGRRGEQGIVYGGGIRAHQFAYLPLLSGRGGREVVSALAPLLAQDWSRTAAIDILGRLAGAAAVPLVGRFLRSESDDDVLATITALDYLDSCEGLGDMRSLLASERAPGTRFLYSGIAFIGRCGSERDLSLLEGVARRDSRTREVVVRQMYRLGGTGALAAMRRVLAQGPLAQSWPFGWSLVLSGFDIASDGIAIPFLLRGLAEVPEGAQPVVGAELALRGRQEGLTAAARIAIDSSADAYARFAALGAFVYVQGPEVRTLLHRLAGEDESPMVRSAAVSALRNYDDEETLELLLGLLSDSIPEVRIEAQGALVFNAAPAARRFLEARVDSVTGVGRLRVLRALQTLGAGTFEHDFRSFLEHDADTVRDMDAVAQAVLGLRDAYARLPDTVAQQGLRSPSRFARHGAIFSLSGRQAEAGDASGIREGADSRYGVANFTERVFDWMLTRLESAEAALAQGQVGQAAGFLSSIEYMPEASVFSTLIDGMSIPAYSFGRDIYQIGRPREEMLPPSVVQRMGLARARIRMEQGLLTSVRSTLRAIIPLDPSIRQVLRDDPAFRALHDFYWFRVYVGLEEPRLAEGLDLGAISGN